MAKKSTIEKEKRRRRLVQLKWKARQELKRKILALDTPEEERALACRKLNKMSKNSSPVRLRNRCMLSGRGRGYLRKFKLSRICFREMSWQGLIPGIVKASW